MKTNRIKDRQLRSSFSERYLASISRNSPTNSRNKNFERVELKSPGTNLS